MLGTRSLSPENLLLIYCAMAPTKENTVNKVRRLLRRHRVSLDWVSIARKAVIHKVFPQLYYTLNCLQTGEALVPQKIKKKLKLMHYRLITLNMVFSKELELILKEFEKLGIRVMLIKGASLARTVYPKPDLRMMDDLDLLVPDAATLRRARSKLLDLGFKPGQGKDQYVKKNGVVIELHEKIGWTIPYLDKRNVWRRASKINVGDVTVPVMSAEDSFLMLCAHSLFHRQINLRDLCDALVILRSHRNDFDWSYVATTAENRGLVVPLYCYVHLLDKLFDVRVVPEVILSRLKQERMVHLFRLILDKTWSMQDGSFAFAFGLYKKFFFERRRLGLLHPIKYYVSTLRGIIKEHVSQGEGVCLIKGYLLRKLVDSLRLIMYAVFFLFLSAVKNLKKPIGHS